jgi:hypothetical protein
MRWGGNIIASFVDAEGQNNYLNVLVCFGFGPATSISDVRINNTPISDYKDATYMVRLGALNQTPIPYFNNVKNGYPQAVRCNAGDPVIIAGTGAATQGLEVVIQFPNGVFYSNDDGSLRSLSIAYKVEYAVSASGNWQTPVIPRTTQDIITYDSTGKVIGYPGWVVVPTDQNFSSGVVYAHDNNHSPTAYTPGQPWTGTETVVYTNADGSTYNGSITLAGEWQPCDPSLNQQSVMDWSSGFVVFSDTNQAALYNTTKIYNLPPNKYDIRVTKYGSAFSGDPIQPREANNSRTGDQVWIHSITEVQYQDLAYPEMILLGVRALATNQLSGESLNVTALVTHDLSVTLPAALAGVEHDNPAAVVYDMMTADLEGYGGGVDPSQIDVAALAQWAAYNDELVSDGDGGTIRRHVFNGVFEDQSTSLWKALQTACALGNCIPVQIGKNYSFIMDGPVEVPAQVFTSANIKRDSLKDTWMSLDNRSNRIEATFADAGRDYRTDEPCAVMTPDDIQAGVEIKNTRVKLLGCTNRAQAWHWCYRKLIDTKTVTLTRSFDVDIEGVACQVGSVIAVQDDVTQWAAGGRIQDGSTLSSVNVDRADLTYAAGQGWTVSVLHSVVARGTATVFSIVGNLVTLSGASPSGRVLSLIRNTDAAQFAFEGTFASGAGMLQSAFGLSVGDAVTMYDQDVIDTQVVTGYNGTTLTTAAPFLQVPETDSPWVYGQSAGAFPAKMFRVTNIKRKGDFAMTIDCAIYDPSVYSDDTPIITETLGLPTNYAAVSNLVLSENYSTANGGNAGQLSTLSVSWINGQSTAKTELWVAINEPNQAPANEVLLATVSKGTTYTFPVNTGAIVQVRAVGVDAKGTTASWSNAPLETITIQGAGEAPGNVLSFSGASDSSGTALSWMPATNAATYEVRYNFDIANSAWNTGVLLYSGSALAFTDPQSRTGRYLIKAVSASSVESAAVATYSYLESGQRLNLVGLESGQTVNVSITQNAYGSGGCSATLSCPAQPLYRADGSVTTTPASTIAWAGNLAAGTTYMVYTYLRLSDLTLHAALGDGVVPDTATNATSAAICSQPGNYPGPVVTLTTPASGASSSFTSPTLQVNCSYNTDVPEPYAPYYTIDSVEVISGGSGYSATSALFRGPRSPYGSIQSGSPTATLTISGGVVTAVTPSSAALATLWASPPTLLV